MSNMDRDPDHKSGVIDRAPSGARRFTDLEKELPVSRGGARKKVFALQQAGKKVNGPRPRASVDANAHGGETREQEAAATYPTPSRSRAGRPRQFRHSITSAVQGGEPAVEGGNHDAAFLHTGRRPPAAKKQLLKRRGRG
jgi:hypothetical protein